MRYNGKVTVELYDRISGRPKPCTTASVDVDIDDLPDPMQSLTVAALEQAAERVKSTIKFVGGRAEEPGGNNEDD